MRRNDGICADMVETSYYSYKLQVQVSYKIFEIHLGPGPDLDNITSVREIAEKTSTSNPAIYLDFNF